MGNERASLEPAHLRQRLLQATAVQKRTDVSRTLLKAKCFPAGNREPRVEVCLFLRKCLPKSFSYASAQVNCLDFGSNGGASNGSSSQFRKSR